MNKDRDGKNPVTWNYQVQRILRKRDELFEVLDFEFSNKRVTGDQFDRMVDVFRDGLPASVDRESIWESLRGLAGVHLTPQVLKDTAHRLVANSRLLRGGRGVHAWSTQRRAEWVPLQVMACRRQTDARGRLGAVFTFKVLAGSPTAMLLSRWWSMKYCRSAARHLKFSGPPPKRSDAPPKYPFSAMEQFVTLRFYGKLEPELSTPDGPSFRLVKFPPSVSKWNLDQLRHRFRVDPGYACPEGHPRALPCHQCHRGYLSCRAGTKARDHVFRPCKRCEKPLAPFDDDISKDLCVNCHATEATKRK